MFVTPAFAATDETQPEGTALTTETGTAHDAGHADVFPPFDPTTFPSQLLWLAITFGLFYLFLKNTVIPRIGGTLEVRRDRIAQDLDQAARMKEDADAAVAAYEQELADARSKSHRIGQEARDKAKAQSDAERAVVEADLDKQLADAESRIASIKADAMKDVDTIAQETASALVEQLVGKATSAKIAAAVKTAGR